MGYGLSDLMKDVATGGAYSATKAVTGAVTDAVGQASGAVAGTLGQVVGEVAGAAGQGNTSSVASNILEGKELKYCSYVIEGDYLLNSETGQVWLIDKQKKELIPIKRNMLPLESVASAINLDYMKQFLLNQKDTEIGKLHHSVREDFSKHMDMLVSVFDREITSNIKAGKP